MNRSAWLTLTTQCKNLQVLTLQLAEKHSRNYAEASLNDRQRRPMQYGGRSRTVMTQMAIRDTISNKLQEPFTPESFLQLVADSVSDGHLGHYGARSLSVWHRPPLAVVQGRLSIVSAMLFS